MSVEHTTSVPVRWGDVDAAGIVFYPRFYEWYDLGCESLFTTLDMPWPRLFPEHGIVGVPIVESGSRFTSPARYGDTLAVRATVAWVKQRTFRMEYAITVGERAIATGFEVRAWVKRPTTPDGRLEAVAIPDAVASRLRGDAA
jgi:4-hydroxybenzoyl-CoA thioesterase